ncbi:spatacsin [Rana temporaria]|uniref:spatacsin n=1 Tax=Rana temporaria TaxID=8407 RepID=UPI001AAC7D98|nr:spatacsin [Rana temporaria]
MELRVLLDPGITLQDWSEPPSRVALLRHKNLSLCSLLPQGSLHLTVFTTGAPRGVKTHLNGPFVQFLWESGNGGDALLDRNPRLLTLGPDNEFGVHIVCVAEGRLVLTRVCLCDKDTLRQLCAENHVCIPSSVSVRLLSLCDRDILLLVSNSVLVHLRYTGKEQKPKIVSCVCLELDPEAAERISDVCLSHEILFLLDSLGFIYAFDILDGCPAIAMELPERTDSDAAPPLDCIRVSPNLDLLMVSSGCSHFLPLKLSKNFSEDATLCLHMWRGQRHLDSSLVNDAELYNGDVCGQPLGHCFRMDRSWDAILSSLSKETKSSSAFPVCPSTPSLTTSAVSTDAALTCVVLGAGWVKISTDNMKDPVRLHSWSLPSSSALFSLSDVDGCATLAHWDVETQVVEYHALGKALCVDGADDEACLIITDQGLSLVLFAVSQNEFLTRLMIHGSASTADTLCYLNNWGRCSVPIHTLEAGLENRQLDTVDFFLKSKESILTPLTCEDGSVQSDQYLHNVQDLVPALDLLYSYIQGTDQEPQSKHFSEHLLQLTLHFLNGQVVTLCDLLVEPDPGLEKCVGILSGYINKLRSFMRRFHQQPFPVKVQQAERGIGEWESMSMESIISDAILSNGIPEAQSFLRAKGHHSFSLPWMKREGLKMAFKCLMENQVTEACQLLQNMGYSVWDELRRICMYTCNLAVRDLLVNLLQQKGLFSEEEQERIRTVYQIEKLCNAAPRTAGGFRTYPTPPWKTGDLTPAEQALQNALCSVKDEPIVLLLQWAQDWDSETQESILLPWRIDEDLTSVSPKILWRHLTLWHDWPRIEAWIDSMGHREPTGDSQHWPPLSPDIIDENTLCSKYTRERILNKLARMNIFVPSELNDFESLMQRLVDNRMLMPPADSPMESITTQFPDFHNRFVVMCVERGLQHLLYPYLDHHSLQAENCSALSDPSLHEAHPWFGFMAHIRQVGADPNDASRMFNASLSNAHVLMPGYQPSLSSMLLEGHTLLALATNMYAPGGIDGVLQQSEESGPCKWNVDPALLKMALAPYPKLKAALFPQHPPNTPAPPDITLYHLLQSLPPFHPSKFFTWQPTNPFAPADSSTELPHFSCPRLVSKYAIQEQLDLFFYLRSGRPSMAFYTFIVKELLKVKDPQPLIQQAAADVYVLALSSFSVPSIVSSCVCFLELLGRRSHKLRVDVNVANVILKHATSDLEESEHKSHTQELGKRLLKLVDNEAEAAKDLLTSLEEVVAVDLEKERSTHCNGLWVTAVQFCHLHSIPSTSLHLRYFAQNQDWLQLLVHANSQEEVFNVLNDLNPVLAGHIALALKGKGSAECPIREADMETNPNTVHHVLEKCLNTSEPSKMLLKECMRHGIPLFSVLSTCTENADLLSCMCAFIVTSVNDATHLEITQTLSTPEDHKWKLEDLAQIWNIVLGRKDSRTLHKAFSIFMEDCPLLLLLDVFELCAEYKDYSEAKKKILEYHEKLEELRSIDDSSALPIPVVWLQTQASHLLRVLLLQSPTSYEVLRFLQLLSDTDCQPLCGDLEIHKLRVLTEIIEDQPFFMRRGLLSDYSAAALQEECQRLLQILVDGGQFSLAHQVAKLAELPTDNLVIEEVLQDRRHMQELGQWECPQSRAQYWRKCHEIFNTNHLSPLVASNFFRSKASRYAAPTAPMAEKMECLAEQELLLSLAGHWLSKDNGSPLATLEELEQQIWNCRIEKEILDSSGGLRQLPSLSAFSSLTAKFSFSAIPVLNTPLLLDVTTLPPLCNAPQEETDRTRTLSSFLDRLLDESMVHEASRVCRYFQLSHLDVWLVLSCRALASGDVPVSQLHPDIQNILAEGIEAQANIWSRRKRLYSSSSVESPASRSPTDPILVNMETLKDKCRHGKAFCRQLLCMYELSQDLHCSFSEVSSRDPSEVLRTVLSKNRPELADRAQAVISSHRLTPETVAKIVAEECLKFWRTMDKEGGQTEMYNVSEKRDNFLQLAKLCPDPTLVGLNLLEHLETVPLTELQAIIEVLISAHECFSLTCHLEGIRRVLHVCRHLTEMHLARKREYSLMVRLLSGIGRYNDMFYVFDILHKNQHFELLLRKQLDTKGGLQTALLEYIKRCHPGDSEKHNMTALCFSMNRDIGHNHEHAAKIQLKLIQSQPWEHWMSELEELKSSIMKALTLLIDAAESYSKDSCVRQSLRCARLTRLLTLQLHLLKSGHKTQLINLDRESLIEPIMALPRFYQAVIVSEAYEVQPDWAEVLYQKVIVGGDFQYLEELKQRQLLSKGVFEQISNKCKLNPPGGTGLQNLRRVISCCKDINLQYNLAIENNFYDITDVLMRDSQTRCCLTDMLSQ